MMLFVSPRVAKQIMLAAMARQQGINVVTSDVLICGAFDVDGSNPDIVRGICVGSLEVESTKDSTPEEVQLVDAINSGEVVVVGTARSHQPTDNFVWIGTEQEYDECWSSI